VAATPDVLFFKKVTNRELAVEYFGVNRKTLIRSSIAQVKDEKKMKMLRRNEEDAALMARSLQPDGRDDFVTWNYVHKILYRPVKSALYRIGNYTCIFNIPEQQIEFYDSAGNFSYKLVMKTNLIRDGRWTGDVMVDEVTGKVYSTFIQNGTYHVYEINVNSGVLKKRISLVHFYPQKIKVYNSFIYYLYDVAGNPDNKMLFRQKF
jgi:hypothetical protein